MMRRLVPPSFDFLHHYRQICESKQQGLTLVKLRKLKLTVANRFYHYGSTASILESIKPRAFSKLNKIALLHCYDSPTTASEALKTTVLTQQVPTYRSRCPFCLLGEIDAYDHYLPKSKFPDFCVFGLNLIPCCGKCNRYKGNVWLKNNQRMIWNPYFDPAIEYKYLFADFKLHPEPSFEFRIVRPPQVSLADFRLTRATIKRLKLLERFNNCALDEISDVQEYFRVRPEMTVDERRDDLNLQALALGNSKGQNYWRSATYYALAACDDFLKSLPHA